VIAQQAEAAIPHTSLRAKENLLLSILLSTEDRMRSYNYRKSFRQKKAYQLNGIDESVEPDSNGIVDRESQSFGPKKDYQLMKSNKM
jgi:hypothetical protein